MLNNESIMVLFLLGVVAVAGLLFGVIVLTRRVPKGLNREKYQGDWLEIEQSITDDSGTWQLAVIRADKLLDRALKELRFKGSTMGERMTSASRSFTKREAVWMSHKLRNRLVHEDDIQLSLKVTKQALASFKYALKDLGAL